MNIRLLKAKDIKELENYLAPHKAECMFICSNLAAAGIEYESTDFTGEYFGYFNISEQLLGIIVHYWNGNVMMHAYNQKILEQLNKYFKDNIKRPIAGVLGLSKHAQYTIRTLVDNADFRINRDEGLYEISLENIDEISLPINFNVVSIQNISIDILIEWMKDYNIEALGASNDDMLKKQVEEDVNRRLKKNDSWVLMIDQIPVSISAFNARLTDMVQVGPIFTPYNYRNKNYARLLLAYILHKEKLSGTKQAILFTNNPAAIKAYLAIGFKKIGNYRLALLQKPIII